MTSTIGKRIKETRKSNGLNQVEFSNIVGVSQGTLSEIEQDKYKPALEILLMIHHKFRVDLVWLVKGDIGSEMSIIVNESESNLIASFRRLNSEDQFELLELIRIKLRKYSDYT